MPASFLVPVDYWPVHEAWAWETPPEANVYAWILSVIHGFRMPLFFLLSGFFTAMLWQSRGLRRLWRHRVERLGLPLLAGMFTVVPAIVWLDAGADFTPLDWPLAWVGGLHHLWFLWYLLLIMGAFIVAARLGLTFRHPAWWLLLPLTVAPQYAMHELAFGPDTEDGLIPAGRVFAYYAIFFAFGVFFRQRDIAVRPWWALGLVPSLLLLLPAWVALLYDEGFEYAGAPWVWAVAAVVQVAFAWLMCFGSMGLFRWIFAREPLLGALPVGRLLLALPDPSAARDRGADGARDLADQHPPEVPADQHDDRRRPAGRLPGGRALHRDRVGDERAAHPGRTAGRSPHGAPRGSRRVRAEAQAFGGPPGDVLSARRGVGSRDLTRVTGNCMFPASRNSRISGTQVLVSETPCL